eukprot:snap_masked-scaffold_13-processed-gene-5.19-mRNA-1 protein AED:1.00 eAED:1.00 QI:0/-1/0/0/-1/1/1/0/59
MFKKIYQGSKIIATTLQIKHGIKPNQLAGGVLTTERIATTTIWKGFISSTRPKSVNCLS